MTTRTQLESLRQRAVEILLSKADNLHPMLIDYHLDDFLRNQLDLPTRPENQDPYEGWMVGQKESTSSTQLSISQTGISFIKKWEGCRLKAYQCSAHVWTIGWGHTAGVKPGMVIDQSKADSLFLVDIKQYEQAVTQYVQVPLNQNQYDALVSFCYNVGIGAFQKSTLLRVLNQQNYDEAANQFLRWTRAGNKVIQGLVNRRTDEKELFLS